MSKTDFINTMREKYSYERESPSIDKQADTGAFKKFNDYVSQNNDQAMWEWVGKQPEVVQSKTAMMDTFNFYLFEQAKAQFVQFCKENSLEVVENYVEVAINTSKNYVSPLEKFEKERESLLKTQEQMQMIIQQQAEMLKNRNEVIKI